MELRLLFVEPKEDHLEGSKGMKDFFKWSEKKGWTFLIRSVTESYWKDLGKSAI